MNIKLFLLFLLLFNNCIAKVTKMNHNYKINIIPKPTNIELTFGFIDLRLIKKFITKNDSKEENQVASLFEKFLKPISGIDQKISEDIAGIVFIELNPALKLKKEEYILNINDDGNVYVKASSKSGLFYAFQSFRQLCPSELENSELPFNTTIPTCVIKDSPKFSYRGMHLDVSRHFFDVEFVKTYIDMIALHKMNVFHWHLTDDNGWRIEIKKYPGLTEKSAWRVDRTHQPWKEQSPIRKNEKSTYGGFYTQEEIREVVSYAAKRNITVIPEIEMPGHTSEVFAAYPELSCKGDTLPVQPGTYWPTVDIFCAGNDTVFNFLENVLEEVFDLFPSKYIHIGGDEAEKTFWKTCKKCQKRIIDQELKNEHELQSWFIKRIEKFVLSKDKKLIGWDEILEGGLAKSATVMSWRGMNGGIEAASAGHEVIMCPTSHCYFDYYQASPNNSPVAFGGLVTLKNVYSFNPIPDKLLKSDEKYIIGAQGNLWTEYVQTAERAQYRVLPRMTALSEVLWSGPGVNSFGDFYKRLNFLKNRFQVLKWNFAPGSFAVEIIGEYDEKLGLIKICFSSEKPGEEIRYTLNGKNPDKSSLLYKEPFFIKKSKTVKASIFTRKKADIEYSEKSFIFHKAMGKKVKYNIMYDEKYSGNGSSTLVNGFKGSKDFSDNSWQGWKSEDLDIIIDLEQITRINSIMPSFLEDHDSRIFLPEKIIFSFSKNGSNYSKTHEKKISPILKRREKDRFEFLIDDINQLARYVKVQTVGQKVCPKWHSDKGEHCWLFVDEVIIN